MKPRFLILALLPIILASLMLGSTLMAEPKEGEWLTNYKQALELSEKTKKPILVDFTGSDWCIWCKRLKAEVFETDEFKAWATKNVILLELDFPRAPGQSEEVKKQNDELKTKFGIKGFPTILFLNAKGEKIGQTGYKKGGPKEWIPVAEAIIKEKK